MADWVNKGSYANISDLLPSDPITALVPTSQAGGNMMSSNEYAMTAPGGEPTDPLPDRSKQGHVKVDAQSKLPPGEDGKPQAKGEDWSPPGAPAWKSTTVPEVVRTPDRS